MKGNPVSFLVLAIGGILIASFMLYSFLTLQNELHQRIGEKESLNFLYRMRDAINEGCNSNISVVLRTYGDVLWNGSTLCTKKYINKCVNVSCEGNFYINPVDGSYYTFNIDNGKVSVEWQP